MKVQLPKKIIGIVDKFENQGFGIYIVGGAVRDIIMGKPVYDWDFTTNAKPEETEKLLGKDAYQMGFGTVGAPSGQEDFRPFEITTFRTEHGYSDSRRPDKVDWGEGLEEDLQRRDFTINAMALKVKSSTSSTSSSGGTGKKESPNTDHQTLITKLIDPFGGQKDLDNKLIRAVGDAKKRFSEDALRMMRAGRIASELGFTIEKETLDAIKENTGLINKIAAERIKDELMKILASPDPYHGMKVFRETGLMEEILPELENTFGVEQKSPQRHHIYDVGTHSMRSLKFVAERNKDPIVRFATLIHDIGKPQTRKVKENGVVTFYNHEVVSAKIAKNIADRLKFSKKEKESLYRLVRYHQFTVNEDQTDSAIRRFIKRVGIENVPDMLDLRVGDRLGGGARETSWRLEEFKERLVEVQKQPFTVHDLKISGNDVMDILDIDPGPKVGEILEKLYKEVVDKKIPNEKKPLLARLKEIKREDNF